MNHLPLRTRIALEIERQLRHERAKVHPLHQLFWECTLRCNLHCLHCGSDCKADTQRVDMPARDFLKVIDSITPHVDPHKLMIVFSGGEPLVRQDLAEVGKEVWKRGYPWGMVSNGMLLSEERLNELVDSGLRSISISLDGLQEDHNWLRGHEESFERALKAVQLIAKRDDIVCDVVSCINQRNFPHINSLRQTLWENGIREWRLFTIFPVGRAAQHKELQLNDDQFIGLLDFIEDTRKEGKIHAQYACEGFLGKYEGRVRDHLYSCQAGLSVAGILTDGSISACTSIRHNYKQGNIYKDDFWDVWENRFQVFRHREWAKQGICKDCKMFRYCEGNGMHLHDDNGQLLFCHYQRIASK